MNTVLCNPAPHHFVFFHIIVHLYRDVGCALTGAAAIYYADCDVLDCRGFHDWAEMAFFQLYLPDVQTLKVSDGKTQGALSLHCHCIVAALLLLCYCIITALSLHRGCMVTALLLHCCRIATSWLMHCYCIAAASFRHHCRIAVPLLLHCYCSDAALLLLCCRIATALLLQ